MNLDSWQGLEKIFFFIATSRPVLVPTYPSIQWIAVALSPGVKWLGHEADHSPSPNAKVQNVMSYISTPQFTFMVWCLIKQ
jgi:hypothetical protein